MKYSEITGDLIECAQTGMFDVIAHGCNCFCVMGSGIAPQMAEAFGCDKFPLEHSKYRGDINKLGQIDFKPILTHARLIWVVNCYSQFNTLAGKNAPLDYEALTLCLRKINLKFRGLKIGLPKIGCGLAGGDWNIVKEIIQRELKDVESITIVFYVEANN